MYVVHLNDNGSIILVKKIKRSIFYDNFKTILIALLDQI